MPHACKVSTVRFLDERALYFQDNEGAPAGFSLLRRSRSIQLQYAPPRSRRVIRRRRETLSGPRQSKNFETPKETLHGNSRITGLLVLRCRIDWVEAPEDRFPEEFGPALARRGLDGPWAAGVGASKAPLAGNTKVRAICMGFASH